MPSGHRTTARSTLALLAMWALTGTLAPAVSAAVPNRIFFPVVGPVRFEDDFGAARGSRSHQGNDIMAARWSPVVAVEAGRVERPSWSSSDCALILHGRSGTEYWYLHLNDQPARRGGQGGCREGVAYAPGLKTGDRVRTGELVGFVGNSGNAAGGAPHLHFELHPGGGSAISPYRWLRRAPRLLYAVPGGVARVRLALYGIIRGADDELSLRVDRVAVSRGWRGKPAARRLSLAYAPGVVVERKAGPEAFAAATLAAAAAGERVSVLTTWFKPTLRTQIAKPSVLSAFRIRLQGRPD